MVIAAMLLSVEAAATAVHAGNIIAYPTEAIYGLGCDPDNQTSLQQLLEIKARATNKGLILVGSEWQQLEPFVELTNQSILDRALESWPGPVTWIMPASDRCSALLTGGRKTIAVRVSAHTVVRDLCNEYGNALVSTSANISGEAPLRQAEDVADAFASQIAGVVEGKLGGLENATSIFDATTGVQLR